MTQLLSQIAIGALAGVGSAWLALFQFRAQHRWERKEDAYKEVLEALHTMRHVNEIEYDAELEHRDIPDERREQLHDQWKTGRVVTDRYADIGAVILSAEVEKILIALQSGLAKNSNEAKCYFDVVDGNSFHLRIAMNALKAAALADRRRVPTGWLRVPKWLQR